MASKGTVVVVDLATPQLAEAIHKAGYKALALVLWHDRVTPSAWGIEAAGYDYQIRLSTTDPLEKIEQALQEIAPDIVGFIPTNEPSEEIVCRLAERFGLPHNDPNTAAVRWNKAKVKELAAKAGLRVPAFQVCKSEEEIKDFAQTLSFPVIIKTPAGSASVNVFTCGSLKDLLEKHHIITTTPDDFGNQPTYSVVEEYIGGTEYQVNTFSDGKNIHVTDIWLTKKIDTKFASNLYYNSWLTSPQEPSLKSVVEYVKKIAQATGITYGPGHIEVKVDEEGPALIEAHARFGGGKQPELLQELSNFDPYAATVEVFTGGKTTVPHKIEFSAHAAVVSCPTDKTCENGTVSGINEISKLPSFQSFLTGRALSGGRVEPTLNMQNYPLRVSLVDKNLDRLHTSAEKVHQLFQIVCKGFE